MIGLKIERQVSVSGERSRRGGYISGVSQDTKRQQEKTSGEHPLQKTRQDEIMETMCESSYR